MRIAKLVNSLTTNSKGLIIGMETENIYIHGKLDLKTNYSATDGDKLYIESCVKIPRSRIRNWGSNLNIKIVRDRTKANIRIFDNNSEKYKMSSTNMWLTQIDFVITDKAFDPDFKKLINLNYEFYLDDDVVMTKFYPFDFDNDIHLCFRSSFDYHALLNKSQGGYSSEALLDNICLQANVLTMADYYALRDMLNSENEKDVGTAMSIMANCNYRKSLHFLLYLYKNCKKLDTHPNRNNVDFKSLTYYLFQGYPYINVDIIIDKLIINNLITIDTITDISKLIKEEVPISEDFHIANLGISERLTKILKQQKLDSSNAKLINSK